MPSGGGIARLKANACVMKKVLVQNKEAVTLKRTRSLPAAFFLLGVLPLSVRAQEKTLSPKAQELTQALAALRSEPADAIAQERYLKAFPHDYKGFLELFDLDHELYDGSDDYIDVLPSLAKNHATKVGKLLVGLSKDAHAEADAPAYLQHATAAYGGQHTRIFGELLKQLPSQKQSQLITFLADVENHSGYPEYQVIIDRLKGLGEQDLASKFEEARKNREQQPHG